VTVAIAGRPTATSAGVTVLAIVVGRGITVTAADPVLAEWMVLAAKAAVMVRGPEALNAKVTEQEEALAPVGASTHPASVSPPEEDSPIVRAGAAFVPSAWVSVTVIVRVTGCPTINVVALADIAVEVLRVFT